MAETQPAHHSKVTTEVERGLAQASGGTGLDFEPTPNDSRVMSRSNTLGSDEASDPAATLSDVNGRAKGSNPELSGQSMTGVDEKKRHKKHQHQNSPLAELSNARKNFLTLVFCISMFIDSAGVSATFVMTAPIAADLGVTVANEAWILGSYSMVFAACLLFAGRLADLCAPNRVFTIGFAGIAVFYLIISFMNDQYAFFVLRAISALFAVLTVPSSLNMLVQMWPDPDVQSKKLALFGMAGALANTIALVLGGLFLLASWRWYFRFITILVAPFTVVAWFMMPHVGAVASEMKGTDKWKRMDLGGVFLALAGLVLFILGFTQASATSDGWSKPIFIAPFVIAIVLIAAFLLYERFALPKGYSMLPHDMWSYPNIFPLILQASSIFLWFALAQLRLATYFQAVLHESAILAAARLLPMGITALVVGVATQAVPYLINKPHFVQPIASAMCFCGSMLFAYSNGGNDKLHYWGYLFTGQVIGTAGGMLIFISMQNKIIQSFPLEYAGIAGSFANVIFQLGGVIGISIQAGLLSVGDGTLNDWRGSQASYWFSGGYVMASGLIFLAWYRESKMPIRTAPEAAAAPKDAEAAAVLDT